ncbi:hypothetical protein BC829DRAFT_445306 [Chytridium lagenaria]|nr:hypothetical protein BC829DRAFT_445306 [Chytridium lagenaria]
MPRVVTGMAASWNHQLHKAMAEASTAHPGAHIALMDVFKVVTDVLVEGTTAFVNTKEPCYRNGPVRERTPGPMNFTETVTGAPQICKDPAGYVFWDGVYFTSRMHEIIASGALDMVRTGKTGMNGTFGSPRAATTVVVTAFTATPKPTSGGAVGGSFMGLGWVMALACGVSWLW